MERKTLPTKRKLSANICEENPRNKKKKMRSNEKNKRKNEKSLVCEKSNEGTIINDKISDDSKTSAKKVAKGSKTQTSKAQKAVTPTQEKCRKKSVNNESSDELPLSEIIKRSKAEQNVKEKLPIKKKPKKCSPSSQVGRTVEAKVKIVKSATNLDSSSKNAAKKEKNEVSSCPKGKSFKANNKNTLTDVDQTSNRDTTKVKEKVFKAKNSDQTSNKDAKTSSSNKQECKAPSPVKHKRKAKDFEDAKGNSSAKYKQLSSNETKSRKEKVSLGEEQTVGHLSVKEMAKEGKVSERIVEDFDDSDEDGDASEMDWEDVAEVSGIFDDSDAENVTSDMPSTSSNVEVTLTVPGQKKSKCGRPSQEEIRKWIQRKINRVKKEGQITAHKVHLLALLAIGLKKNEMCNNPLVKAVGLSLLPDVFAQRKDLKTWDIPYLTRITTWMKNKAPNPGEVHTGNSEATYLMRVLEKKVYLLIVILRALGLSVRLVMSLQVLSNKIEDVKKSKKPETKRNKTPGKTKETTQLTKTPKQTAKKEAKKTPKETLLTKLKGKSTPAKSGTPSTSKSSRKKAKVDYTGETKSEYFTESLSDDDEDFEIPALKTPKRGRSGGSRPVEPRQHAPAGGETSGIVKKGRDIWIEVYLEKEKKWICIDGDIGSVNQPDECEKLATKPIKYVMTFDNECSIKDVTRRYASGWLTTTPKLRVDPDWVTKTMNFYRTKNLKRDKKEDSLLKARLLRKPLPQTVSEYKNHPLYVLKRHLLKFQAIYPESAATLGFCRGEAVYSRECVHTLHTRELWMKEARVVKAGEETYKIVKGRKSRRKMLENVGEVKAELFGRWQTKEYIPPPVVDGKVPRNEYGNVELFKPSMLPAGACHIQIPGIHRLARKLNIDAALAVVGFDFHGGFNHPIMDGVVVGEEYKEQLLLAWDKEQDEKIEREQAKREKRVLDNWTHLVRSLRIRERLKRKYNVEEDVVPKSKVKSDSPKETEDMTDISLSWPLNKQEGKTARDDDGHCHVFLSANHVQDPVTGEWSKTCACGLKEPLEVL
ncbi:DNA repair complementing XP-C cells [Paramuricea clavata]|uniref:DNA repair complementing XP-C cells, partial n=1 Tax=Paramuricea clavata TaxID=317549 RepID=A0A7D9E222_PARCT|nr:DNA repair complementing XP-C cells [Paramuricea clavata]